MRGVGKFGTLSATMTAMGLRASHPSLPPTIADALVELESRLREALGGRLREVRLFGSVARGEARADSDVDVLFVLDRLETSSDRRVPLDIAYDVGEAHGVLFQALVWAEADFALHRLRETALARALDQDGIVV